MDLQQLLQQHFGFDTFKPGQQEAMEQLLSVGRALAIFPTGGGKSLCYQLPALALEGTTLVVSPLIALMKDQIDFLRSRGINAARLDSSLDLAETRQVNDDLRSGLLKLLYVAPERFNNERFLETLRTANISLFAVDEAHCISEWGHNFRPDYLKLARVAQDLAVPRILALTATATPKVAESICAGFDIPPEAAINTGFYRPNLEMLLTPVSADQRLDVLGDLISQRAPGTTIVYVTLQKTAQQVADYLEKRGIQARPYHAGLESEARHEVQEWWMQGEARVVVATIAFGMGIDKSNVRYVYHYNLPKGLENYSQEIGRAGRDGQPSVVELLACPDDVPTLENFVYGDTPTRENLTELVRYLLDQGEEFSIKEYDLSQKFDLRPLVLRTALTYLELAGVLKQGTSFYAGYEVRPLVPLQAMYAAFSPKAGAFLRQVLGVAKFGRTWYKLDPDEAIIQLGTERRHIIRAMELLEEKALAEVRAADARQRYHRLPGEVDPAALVEELLEKFARREAGEVKRIRDLLKLVELDGCQSNALVRYFGEKRREPCGHCSWCQNGRAAILPATRHQPAIEQVVDQSELHTLRSAHPYALGQARQVARFLCGLPSPAQTKARIGKHRLFGSLEHHRFGDVLAWAEHHD